MVPTNTTCTVCLLFPGWRENFSHWDVQAAYRRGGLLGTDQRTVCAHHFIYTHCFSHCGRLWDSKESEFATRASGFETLVERPDMVTCPCGPQIRHPVIDGMKQMIELTVRETRCWTCDFIPTYPKAKTQVYILCCGLTGLIWVQLEFVNGCCFNTGLMQTNCCRLIAVI